MGSSVTRANAKWLWASLCDSGNCSEPYLAHSSSGYPRLCHGHDRGMRNLGMVNSPKNTLANTIGSTNAVRPASPKPEPHKPGNQSITTDGRLLCELRLHTCGNGKLETITSLGCRLRFRFAAFNESAAHNQARTGGCYCGALGNCAS